jgi:hopanoid biosynthesis associated protein HpnK
MMALQRRLITVADDFGLSPGVNEAVDQAARNGMLTSASLMVAAPEAADAARRARALPSLHVGLHLVVIEGTPMLPAEQIPDLVDAEGRFPSDQFRLGVDYFFRPRVRRQLAAEIRAQFAAFASTGLTLDHANAHKHMHLHPTVGQLMIDIGREFGLRAIRVPSEPPVACGPARTPGARALKAWSGLLRHQARRAGLLTNDAIFGLGWTGHMTPARVQDLLDALPPGLNEIYFHPATGHDALLRGLMPDYEHAAELEALLSARIPDGVQLTSYTEALRAQAPRAAPEPESFA